MIRLLEEERDELEEKCAKLKEQNEKDLKKQKKEMEDELARDKRKLEDTEKQRIDSEMKLYRQISEMDVKHKKEILNLQSHIDLLGHDVRDEQNTTAGLELELRQQKEELEMSFRQEKQEILELYENKINELEESLSEASRKGDEILKGVSFVSLVILIGITQIEMSMSFVFSLNDQHSKRKR